MDSDSVSPDFAEILAEEIIRNEVGVQHRHEYIFHDPVHVPPNHHCQR